MIHGVPLYMLDLFSGTGSASRAAAVRGWSVTRVDLDPQAACDVRADLRTWSLNPVLAVDLVWASPPCDRFSTAQPARTRDVDAGLELVHAALRIIREVNPRWWVLENVHGATRAIGAVLGPPVAQHGSFYLWGVFPPFDPGVIPRDKSKKSGRQRARRRGAIPWAISDALVRACESLAAELPDRRPPSSLAAVSDLAPVDARAGAELAPNQVRPDLDLVPSCPQPRPGPAPLESPAAAELAPVLPRSRPAP